MTLTQTAKGVMNRLDVISHVVFTLNILITRLSGQIDSDWSVMEFSCQIFENVFQKWH